MSEVLTELVAKISTDAAGLKSGLSDAEKQTEASSKKMQADLQKVGLAMAASGAAITAAFGRMGAAAIDEDINIKRLATTINNSGTAYDNVKDSLEAVIAATQRKTGIADDEQRDVLNRLILVTNDYGKAMELLPTVLDLAAAGEMDATTAATYLGKAYLELEEGADEVSVRFGQASLQFKNMEDIQNRVAGAAENLANPFNVLKASVGDLGEAIGTNLIPIIKGTIDKIVDITIKIQDWIKEHPELTKILVIFGTALGGVLTIMGGLLLVVPKMVALFKMLNAVMVGTSVTSRLAASGIRLVGTALASLLIIPLIVDGMNQLSRALGFEDIEFQDLRQSMEQAKNEMSDMLNVTEEMISKRALEIFLSTEAGKARLAEDKELQKLAQSLGIVIDATDEQTKAILDQIAIIEEELGLTEEKIDSIEELTEVVKREFNEQASIIQETYQKQKDAAQQAYDAAIEAINEEYGVFKSTNESKSDKEKQRADELKRIYEEEIRIAKDRYDYEINKVRDLYNEKRRELDEETDEQTKALQDQIDAIDKALADEELQKTRSREQQKLAELKEIYENEDNEEEKAKAKTEYEKYSTEVAGNERLRQLDAYKDNLRDQIELLRDNADKQKELLDEEENAEIVKLKNTYDETVIHYQKLADLAETNLALALENIKLEREEKIAAQDEILENTLTNLQTAETEEIQFLANQIARAHSQVAEINATYDALQRRYDIDIVTHYWDEYHEGSPSDESSGFPYAGEYRNGGVVPGTIGQPYLATVHGGETIIPANESMGGITVNISGPLFMEREDQMNQLVDKISRTLDRKYRLGGRSLA
jgi:hypothetical protein